MSAGPLIDYLGLILSPAVAPAQGDVPVRGPSGGWTTMQPGGVGGYIQVDPNALSGQMWAFRTDGTVARVNPPAIEAQAWNVSPTSSSSSNAVNLQLAITAANANLGAGNGGPAGKINLGPNVITVDRAILDKFGVKLYGVGGQVNTTLKADPSAPLSNFQNGSKSTFPAILKWDGDDVWAHGVHVVGIHFDTSGIPGLSAIWFQATGENSWFDDLSCSSCAALPRTVTDAQLVAGSATVNFTASTVTEDDVNAILNMGGNTVAPLAPGLSTAGTGGTIGSTSQAQQFTVGITYQTANGETIVSPLTSITVAQVATNTITIASPVAATGATGWVAYVSQPGGGGIIWRQGGVNAIGTSLTLTAPPVNNGISPYNKIDRISWGTNSNAATATSMVMRNPAVATLANVTMVINRPTDAFVFDGGFTPGTIGKLHGVNNSGAVFRSKNAAGTCIINQLSGDDNVGGMARMSTAAQHGDPTFLQINNIKAESDTYNPNWQYSMDPVVLIDRGWTYAINLHGGSFAGGGYVRDVVRLDNSWANTDVGGPSLHLEGVEGQNWYNTAYTNIIHDTQSGEVEPVSQYGDQSPYPEIWWNRKGLYGGGGYERGEDTSSLKYPGLRGKKARHRRDYINLLDYAVGLGLGDETVNVLKVRDAAGSGKTIRVPAGTWLVNKIELMAGTHDNQRWYLEEGAILKCLNGANNPVFWTHANGVRIEGPGKIDGNTTNQAAGSNTGLYFDPAQFPQNCYVGGGLQIVNTRGHGITGCGQYITIEDLWITNPELALMFLQGPSTADVWDMAIRRIHGDKSMQAAASAVGYGIQIRPAGTFKLINYSVDDCDIKLPSSPTNSMLGIEVWGGTTGGCRDGRVKNPKVRGGTYSISLDHNTNSQVQAPNTYDFSSIGVELAACTDSHVSNPQIDGNNHNCTGVTFDQAGGTSIRCSVGGDGSIVNCRPVFAVGASDITVGSGLVLAVGGSGQSSCVYFQSTPRAAVAAGVKMFGGGTVQDGIVCDGTTTTLSVASGVSADNFTRGFITLYASGTIDDVDFGALHITGFAAGVPILAIIAGTTVGAKVRGEAFPGFRGNTTGLTSAQIDALFPAVPFDGQGLIDVTNALLLRRMGGKWYKTAALTQIA